MGKRAIAVAVIIAAVILAVGLRSANRADAAAGSCYSDGSGPDTPTICN